MKIRLLFISFLLSTVTTFGQINTGSPTVPFGSNTSYAYGIMPTNLPTSGTYGKASEIASKYNAWKSDYVENCGSDKARVKFDNTSQTVSEGIAYGMLLAAYAGDKDLLNRLWAYYKQHRNSNGVMHWQIQGCNSVIGQNGATDAELDAAMALIVANYQWPNTTSPHNYKTDAVALINAVKNYEINTTDYTFENGDAWKPACRNPSYQAPGYARVFKLFMAENGQANNAFWDNVTQKTEGLLINNAHGTSGLSTNWCTPAGPPSSSCSGSGTAPDKFGYDACRAPWRQGVDYIWYGPSTIQAITNKQAAYWIGQGGAGNVRGGNNLNHDGSGSGDHNAAFVGPVGALALSISNTPANQAFCNALYTENKNDGLSQGYFTKILQMIGLFVQTGNFWNPYAMNTAPATTSITLTAPTVATAAEGDVITVSATATATSGAISKVEFYAGTVLIGTDNSSPYSISWTANVTGSVSITAVATNTNGDVATSAPFTISIYKVINKTASAPAIDGTQGAAWSASTSASLNNVLEGTIANSGDLSAYYKALWDDNYFYVLVNVTDNSKTNNSGTDIYNDDAVEVFFDIGNDKSSTYGSNDFQYTFRWNDNTIYERSNKTTGVTFARVDNSTGYVMTMRFPWSTLTGTPAVNQLVGFDVAVNDDDNGGARDKKIAWAATADQAWTNPSYMGTVILKGTACTLPGAAGVITGVPTTCANTTGVTYSIATVSGATAYTWTVPTGATITSGATTNSIVVTFGTTGGNVTVTPTNTCGNGTSRTAAVTVNALPGAAGAITGVTTTCANKTGVTYSIAAVSGATGYTWTVPTGATITGGANTNSITVTFGTAAGSVSVTPTNTCGNGTIRSVAVTVNALPGAAGAITGVTTTCANKTGVTYSIAAVSGATGYTWTVPTGATITGGTNTNSITVTFGTAGGNVTVTPTNTCGNGTSRTAAVTVNALPSAAGIITGVTTTCANKTGVTYSIAAVSGATGYTWTVPTGATITSGATTNSITVTFGTTGGNVTVTPTNTCGNGTSRTAAVTVNALPGAAGAITGVTTTCANKTGVTYSIAAVSGATGYTWTVPTGATITSGANTNSITVTFGTAGGNVTVTPTNTCGNGTIRSTAVTVNALPGAAGTITGVTTTCANTAGVTYSIAAVSGATGYTWTVPTGAMITSGANTNSITVTFGTAGGNVTVTPTNTCGNGTIRSTAVTVNPIVTPTITASASQTSICTGTTVNFTSVATHGGAATYQWRKNGTNIGGATGASYSTSALANNNTIDVVMTSTAACRSTNTVTSSPLVISVVTSVTASVSIEVSPGSTIYAGQSVTFSSSATNGGTTPTFQWKLNGGNIPGATSATYTSSSLTNGSSISVSMTSNANCISPSATTVTSNTIALTVNSNPGFNTNVTGPAAVISNQSSVTYSVPNQNGMSYTWTVPAGATIVSGQGTNSIVVNFGTTGGNVSVTETNPLGQTSTISKEVTVGTATPILLSGNEGIEVSAYPVPCTNGLTIDIGTVSGVTVQYTFIDLTGNTILEGTFEADGSPKQIETAFASGMYQLILQWDGKRAIKRITKY